MPPVINLSSHILLYSSSRREACLGKSGEMADAQPALGWRMAVDELFGYMKVLVKSHVSNVKRLNVRSSWWMRIETMLTG